MITNGSRQLITKPYQTIAIADCGEPLVAIPAEFSRLDPHPYVAVGAPYGDRSPFFLRSGIVQRLQLAQARLQQRQPTWRLQIFDAYRPIAVQQYMVDHSFAQECQRRGLVPEAITAAAADSIWQAVYQFWAVPSLDLAMPPPHSTGAAVDLTLIDGAGKAVAMGSEIDQWCPSPTPSSLRHQRDSRSKTIISGDRCCLR